MSQLIHKAAVSVLLFALSGLVNYKPTQAETAPPQSARVSQANSIKYQIFDTNSPNKRYAIAWGIPGRKSNSPELDEKDDFEKVENYLVDTKTNKVITKLKYSKTFPNQNHGGITAAWAPNSKLVLVVHNGKWQPRNVSLVNTSGVQVGIFDQLVKDTRTYLAKNDGAAFQKNKEKLIFSLDTSSKSFKLTNNRFQIPIITYIPKALNGYEANVLLTYQVDTNGNPKLNLVNVKKVTPSP
ncbi:hypothetical protein DSM106972_069510 [Dulcicalothrix desertica PCC 7102]|uniref:Uncharacterized protein n=1 Tax=Dulcicalothrix desertica PCC 7102 TaxID=232991 RepID=A0A3S1AXP0_9CYAN|nr:hypothetical protein [Dulcicalothrix desertica]RUT00945.1 hypothetical protein DSM106972_069510 [Dulcicalothrix desertica PCC 7102]TWH39915.1 hypothetical protein CAL7102_09192 [Dulcicalothrix desertica PCC 7102]